MIQMGTHCISTGKSFAKLWKGKGKMWKGMIKVLNINLVPFSAQQAVLFSERCYGFLGSVFQWFRQGLIDRFLWNCISYWSKHVYLAFKSLLLDKK